MIPSVCLEAMNYSFDRNNQIWSLDEHEMGGDDNGILLINKRSKINFIVDKIHECAGTVSLEGSNPEYGGEVEDDSISSDFNNNYNNNNNISNIQAKSITMASKGLWQKVA